MSKELEKAYLELKDLSDIKLEENKDLTSFSTLKLRVTNDLISIYKKESVSLVLKTLKRYQIQYRVLGWGANQIISEKEKSPYIKLCFEDNVKELESYQETYHLSASVSIGVLTNFAIKHGLKGWEVFTGIPASLGGAIAMNAGTNLGEMAPLVEEVEIVRKDGHVEQLKLDKNSFSYRCNNFLNDGDIIISAKLKNFGQDLNIAKKIKDYLKLRADTQPLNFRTCGCTFKNASPTCRAGKFIDILNLKGFKHAGIQVSQKHANFLINTGDASYQSFIEATEIIQKELYLQFGIKFELEVQV